MSEPAAERPRLKLKPRSEEGAKKAEEQRAGAAVRAKRSLLAFVLCRCCVTVFFFFFFSFAGRFLKCLLSLFVCFCGVERMKPLI